MLSAELNNVVEQNYMFGKKYNNVYFTKREVECMVWLMRGRTFRDVAKIIGVSHRTVEEYVNNMRRKLHCRNKVELIELVERSDFVKKVFLRTFDQ